MTQKRFELKWRDTGEVLYDNETGLEHGIYSPDYRFHVRDKLNELAEEKDYFERKKEYFLSKWSIANAENIQLRQENKELQERNDRQAKQLGNIYHLIEKQDWKALKGIIDEFKECEEQLQKEWPTYGDVE